MLNWLFRVRQYELVQLAGSDAFDFPIVGESHYPDALEELAGGRDEDSAEHQVTAQLMPEPGNKFDKNAVMVQVEGHLVGYLSRDMAVLFHSEMSRLGKKNFGAWCFGEIVGGWERDDSIGHFGLKLDLALPFRIVE